MNGNSGISASGGAHVVGNAVASGTKSKAEVHSSGPAPAAGGQLTPQEIRDLLARVIDELGRSDHPERADLIEAAQDAREELDATAPRTGKLRVFARGLAGAVAGFASLASLTATVEQAIQGL